MSRIALILLWFCSSFAAAAEVYRWIDERGVTHYGEKPPADRPAKPINTRPAAATVDARGKVVDAPKPVTQPAAPAPLPAPAVAAAAPPPPSARGMEFGVYIHLRHGMSEGEVLLRAGPPDYETIDGGRFFVVKSMYYYPTLADPYITVVRVRGGRVTVLERTRKF